MVGLGITEIERKLVSAGGTSRSGHSGGSQYG